ncbi:MAG: hypothetical protein EZS28_041927 [Streblomastix strix]|uniref:Uncharacterized protein n=1 Tax=Streblomastix strix TaxID=222440 RepID=A0A5J4TW56_9EUKA|nr:MAG: hypothetical protein EZS28_041927 [Streblomastix strix]
MLYVLEASVPTNAITQSPCFGLASCGQLLNKQPFGETPAVAYDAHSALVARTLHLMRRQYLRYFSLAIAEFGLQLKQVAAVARVAQDNVL